MTSSSSTAEGNQKGTLLYRIGNSYGPWVESKLAIIGEGLQRKTQERAMVVRSVHMCLAIVIMTGVYGILVMGKYVYKLLGSRSEEQQDRQVTGNQAM